MQAPPYSADPAQVQPQIPMQNPVNYTQNITITTQPGQALPPKRAWSTGLCGCSEDATVCLCVWCCTPFYQCYKMDEFGEHCCNAWPCCLGPLGSFLMLRYKMRGMHNIEGTMMTDFCTMGCCPLCATCQVIREHDLIRRSQASAAAAMVPQM